MGIDGNVSLVMFHHLTTTCNVRKLTTASLLASALAVSFTTVTLEVTNTISTWMPHYSTTSAYMLGPERLWHQSENEMVRFAFACQRLLSRLSLGDGHTFFQIPTRLLRTQTMQIWHSLERRQLPCRDCKPRRVHTCHWKPGLIFHIPCYSSSRPPGTSWPGTLKQHRKNIISPNCLLPPVPCLTCTSLLHR